jgi:hypothetical protein
MAYPIYNTPPALGGLSVGNSGAPQGGTFNDRLQGALGSPLMQIGLGILANNNSRNTGQVLGRGALAGINGIQRAQQLENTNKMFQMQMEQNKRAMNREDKMDKRYDYEMAQKRNQGVKQDLSNSQLSMQYGIPIELMQSQPEIAQKMLENKLIPKETDSTTSMTEYNLAKSQGYNGSFLDFKTDLAKAGRSVSNTNVSYGSPVAALDSKGNPVFFQPSKDGSPPSIIKGVAPPAKDKKSPTEGQSKSATFYSQMRNANKVFESLKDYDPSSIGSQFETSIAGGGVGNMLVSPASQQAKQAQNQWAEAFLRIKTGAAANQDEIKNNVQTFFPQVGDSPAVIAQKALARKQAEEDVAQMTQNPEETKMRAPILPAGATMPNSARSREDILKEYGVNK